MSWFSLRCGSCEADTRVNSLVYRTRKESGLPYTCHSCGENLYKVGYKTRHGKTDSQKRSAKQEKTAAKRTGGRVTPGSGNQPGIKGDVRVEGSARIECKCTTAKSYSLKLVDLMKIEEAADRDENPVLEIEFQGIHPKRRYVVIPGWLYDHYESLSGDAQ